MHYRTLGRTGVQVSTLVCLTQRSDVADHSFRPH